MDLREIVFLIKTYMIYDLVWSSTKYAACLWRFTNFPDNFRKIESNQILVFSFSE